MVHPFGTVTVTVTAAAVAAASAPSATGVAYASVRAISSMLLSCQMRCASVSHACMHCMYLCICAFVHVWPECVCYKHNIVIHDVITARTTNRSQKSHQNARRRWFAFAGGIKFQNFPVCDTRRVCVWYVWRAHHMKTSANISNGQSSFANLLPSLRSYAVHMSGSIVCFRTISKPAPIYIHAYILQILQ